MTKQEAATVATFRKIMDQPGTPAFRAAIEQAMLARICDCTGDPTLNFMIHKAWGEHKMTSAPSAPQRSKSARTK